MDLKALIREVPDFPKPGISYKDITTLLRDADGLQYAIATMAEHCADLAPDYVAGMESRGFIFGTALACKMGIGFVPIRKLGKLPAAVHTIEYDLEYGTDKLEIHQDAYPAGSKVLMVDDLIATGGTAGAAAKLIQQAGGALIGCAFVIELIDLNGRQHLPNVPIIALVQY